jgi:hypothetical protein
MSDVLEVTHSKACGKPTSPLATDMEPSPRVFVAPRVKQPLFFQVIH